MEYLLLAGKVLGSAFLVGFVGPVVIAAAVLGYIALNKFLSVGLWLKRKLSSKE